MRVSPSCRDKGRMWGRVGAWCLSWWQRDPLSSVRQDGRTPTRTSTRPPHPLHPAPCPYRTRDAHFPIRLSTIIRTLGTQAFRWCNYPIRLSTIIRTLGRKHLNRDDYPIRPSKFIRGKGGEGWWGGPLWSPAVPLHTVFHRLIALAIKLTRSYNGISRYLWPGFPGQFKFDRYSRYHR